MGESFINIRKITEPIYLEIAIFIPYIIALYMYCCLSIYLKLDKSQEQSEIV